MEFLCTYFHSIMAFHTASLQFSCLLMSSLSSLYVSEYELYKKKHGICYLVMKLLQVRAIAPQSLEHLLQSIHECLGSSDWATRKAAADALISLALHSSNLITDGAASTLTALETCRFDKVSFFRHIHSRTILLSFLTMSAHDICNILIISLMVTINAMLNGVGKVGDTIMVSFGSVFK